MSGQHPFAEGWQRFGAPPPPFFAFPPPNFSRPPPPLVRPRPLQQFQQASNWQRNQAEPRPVDRENAEDREWVSKWLEEKGATGGTSSATITLKDVKLKVHRAADILSALEKLRTEFEVDCSDVTDQKIEELKTELSSITTFLESSSREIAVLNHKRKKKQKALRVKRQEAKQARKKQLEERQAKHRQIDAWRQEQQDIVEKAKREEDMAREADAVLSEVRNKQSDGKSLIQVLESLKKLRRLRAQYAADKNEFPSQEENEQFDNMLSKLGDLWELQMEEYAKEEHALKVMMEKNKSEKPQPTSALDANLKRWQVALFGKQGHDSYETMLHTSADRDVDALIYTRRCWDQFVVADNPLASSIPVGWVLPNKPSSEDWESLLESKQ